MEGCVETETTCPRCDGVTQALLDSLAVLVCLQLDGTWSQCSTDGTYGICDAGICQLPSCTVPLQVACACLWVINSIETVHFVTPNLAESATFYDSEVLVVIAERTCPLILLEFSLAVQLVYFVAVVRDVASETECEVLLVDDVSIDGELETLVGGLTEVLILVSISRNRWDVGLHQQVLGCIPIEVEGTIDTTVEEAEVETEVTGDGCFPLQVWIRQSLVLQHGSEIAIEEWQFCSSIRQ